MPLSATGTKVREEFRRKYGGQKRGDGIFYAKMNASKRFKDAMESRVDAGEAAEALTEARAKRRGYA